MRRFFSFLLLPLLALISCKAQTPRAVNDTKSLLWRISGNGLTKPSYLFGTIHLICPDDYFWTSAMQQSLDACRKVCFEMDMDDPAVMSEASGGIMNPTGKQLKDYFTPAQYERISRFVKDSMGIGMEPLQSMKPIALETFMITKIAGCGLPVSYEANIMELAHKGKQEVIGLESAKEQLSALEQLSDDSTVSSLMQMADSMGTIQKEWNNMVTAYKQQDLPLLYHQIKESKELGDGLGVLLDDRNKRWIPRIEKLIKTQATFFAVGAGHLWGNDGLITLLRKAGYTVDAVQK